MEQMRPLALSLVMASAVALSGCSTLVFLNPFVEDEQAVMDPALLGTWASQDGKDTYWISQNGSTYNIRMADESDVFEFKARLMVSGDVKLLDMVVANEDPWQLAVHTAVRVWTKGSTLRVAFLQSDWLRQAAGQFLPAAPAKDRTLVTSAGEAVRTFLTKFGADTRAIDEADVLRRLQ
jgi:hypothetical protein